MPYLSLILMFSLFLQTAVFTFYMLCNFFFFYQPDMTYWVKETDANRGFLFFVFFCYMACGILVPQPGIEPRPLAVKAQNLNHWTIREFPMDLYYVVAKCEGRESVVESYDQASVLHPACDSSFSLSSVEQNSSGELKLCISLSVVGWALIKSQQYSLW